LVSYGIESTDPGRPGWRAVAKLPLFELQEENQVNNVVTYYGSKEIKLVFRDKDDFKVITEQPGRN
jgi:hypothetical protein